MLSRVLIVGESNPYGSDPRYALYPLPENATGGRLCKILGLSKREYMQTFDRTNLVALGLGNWPSSVAKDRAGLLKHRRRILLGKRVADAHSVPFRPFRTFTTDRGVEVLILPHPSGRNLIWNDPRSAVKARRAVGKFIR